MAVTWTKFRGPGDVKFDNNKPSIDRAAEGKTVANATFSAPGDYILRVEGNDSTGVGGGGFQCCWSNVYVAVTVRIRLRRGENCSKFRRVVARHTRADRDVAAYCSTNSGASQPSSSSRRFRV